MKEKTNIKERPQIRALPEDFEKIKNRALRILALRDHSKQELKTKLKKQFKIDDSEMEVIFDYLSQLSLLPDETDLSRRWVCQWRKEGKGRHWILAKLRSKGLFFKGLKDDDDEHETAMVFIGKKLAGKSLKDLTYEERIKLGRALVSRGFSMSLVAEIIK